MGKILGTLYLATSLVAGTISYNYISSELNKPILKKNAKEMHESADFLIKQGKNASYLALVKKFTPPTISLNNAKNSLDSILKNKGMSVAANDVNSLSQELSELAKNLGENPRPELSGPALVSAGEKINEVTNKYERRTKNTTAGGILGAVSLILLIVTPFVYKQN